MESGRFSLDFCPAGNVDGNGWGEKFGRPMIKIVNILSMSLAWQLKYCNTG